jgi:hypothetical protein
MADASTVDRLDAGDHACLTFSDSDERLDLLAAFVRNGVRRGDKVMCWTDSIDPSRLAAELAARAVRPRSALRRGQLSIAAVATTLLGRNPVNAAAMIDALAIRKEQAARDGYRGLRVVVDMGWATRPVAAGDELIAFETAVGALFGDRRLAMMCQYDRDRFDAVTLAFAAKAHTRTVVAVVYHDDVVLRICRQYSPPGVRVAGELDYRRRDALERALAESLRLDRQLHLNLTRLDYIDGACAATIVQTALALPASRRMTAMCRPLVATVLDLVGAGSAPRLRIRSADHLP